MLVFRNSLLGSTPVTEIRQDFISRDSFVSNEILREIWRPPQPPSSPPTVGHELCELDRTEPNYTGRSLDIPVADSSSLDTFLPARTDSSLCFLFFPLFSPLDPPPRSSPRRRIPSRPRDLERAAIRTHVHAFS
jgi:hypothetical protein